MPPAPRSKKRTVRSLSLLLAILCLTSWSTPLTRSAGQPAAAPAAKVERAGSSQTAPGETVETFPRPSSASGLGQVETHYIRNLALATKDLVVDASTGKIYASVPSSAGANGNSITRIDPVAGTAETSVFIGSEPGKMVISDNNQYIYVALDGANAIRRYDVASQTPGLQFNLGSDTFFGAFAAEDIAVQPGHPETIAVSRLRRGVSPRHGGVAIYDNGVARARTTPDHTGANVIEFSNSPSVLYGYNNETTEFGFRKMVVETCGVIVASVTSAGFSGFGSDFRIDNGRGYSTSGRVFDLETGALIGTFSGLDAFGSIVLPDSKANRVYFITGGSSPVSLRVYDMTTFLSLGTVSLPGVSGSFGSLVRWGDNGLAFRTFNSFGGNVNDDRVVLLQSALVGVPSNAFTPAPPPAAPTATIKGRATELFNPNRPIGGVTITLGGAASATTQTDADGNYSFGNLSFCGSYTVRAGKAFYIFSPSEMSLPTVNGTTIVDFNGFPQSISLNVNSFTVNEGQTGIQVGVTRSSGTTSPASVSYETIDGTASERSDYSPARGTLTFLPGETFKTINLFITDDAYAESPETFILKLSNVDGALLGDNSSLTVTINSNDAVTGTSPVKDPAFNTEFFVRQHYRDFFNREPDAAGLAFWKNQIDECTTQECREIRRINVSAAFFVSGEFQQTGYLVYRFYQAAFDTQEHLPLGSFLPDTQAIGRGIIVGQGNWQAQLEANKQAYANSFVARKAFLDRYPLTMSAQAFVDALNANTGGSLSTAERDDLVGKLNSNQLSRAQVLRAVAEDADFARRELNKAFVLMQYFGYLRRNPNDAPELGLNFDGYNFWLGKLNQFNGNYIAAEMVKAFITSGEYQQRFGL